MKSWQIVHVVAGSFVLVSLALGVPASPFFASPCWLFLAAFAGLNLFQAGFTRWCPLELILGKLGVQPGT